MLDSSQTTPHPNTINHINQSPTISISILSHCPLSLSSTLYPSIISCSLYIACVSEVLPQDVQSGPMEARTSPTTAALQGELAS